MPDAPSKTVFELLLAAGPLVWPILASSFVMLLVALDRFFTLRRRAVAPRRFAHCVLTQVEQGAVDREGALELCAAESSCLATVFAAGLRRWGHPGVEVEQAVLDEGERTAASLRRNLRILSGVASVCPLFGLLGTVWGMHDSFESIASSSAMGRAELLAGGISEALLSTAAGLGVAIPAMILHLHFVGRVDTLLSEVDRYGQQLVNLISAEALEDRRAPRRVKKIA
ncbi:MAG: MotA/TolQ/ExbB proton channel family protein [Lacipirellulaceae bacterium]